eukprot:1690685-Prymnesium_polylepis.1
MAASNVSGGSQPSEPTCATHALTGGAAAAESARNLRATHARRVLTGGAALSRGARAVDTGERERRAG